MVSGWAGYGFEMPDPMEDGRRLSPPEEVVSPTHSPLLEQSSAIFAVFVLPASSTNDSLIAYLDESFRRATLDDHLALFVPQPEHLASRLSSTMLDPEDQALAPIVTLIEKNQ